jgi:hypothetical protein
METTSQKLDPEFKTKWVAALRSGEYTQGRHVMYNVTDDSLCCLAVAGLLCGLSKDEMNGVQILNIEHDAKTNELALAQKAIPLGYPSVLIRNGSGCPAVILAEKNDGGKSFLEIADYIEANL